MHLEQFKRLGRVRKKPWTHEDQPEGSARGQLGAQLLSPLLQSRLIKIPGPMGGDRILVPHAIKLAAANRIATPRSGGNGSNPPPTTDYGLLTPAPLDNQVAFCIL